MKLSYQSVDFFRPYWLCWKIIGIGNGTMQLKVLNVVYALLVNILVTFWHPMHLGLAAFRSETLSDNIKNFALFVTCVACSLKFIIYTLKRHKVHEMQAILKQLDARIRTVDERNYFDKLRRKARHIAILFLCVYLSIGVTAEIAFVFREERRLMYPAWFPFNWRDSTRNFYIANAYQIIGVGYQLVQNYLNDSFPAVSMCVLTGHIKLLSLRVSKIGYDNDDQTANERELKRCIRDQKNLYKLFETIQEIISMPMFLQFTFTANNICIAMAALIFFVTTAVDRLYYFVYFIAMPLEIFPTCYYSSYSQILFAQLHHDVYSSNWIEQSQRYKKDMILLTERSLKQNTALAGGMLRIHLDTFFSTCKGAYSLFAVIMNMKR